MWVRGGHNAGDEHIKTSHYIVSILYFYVSMSCFPLVQNLSACFGKVGLKMVLGLDVRRIRKNPYHVREMTACVENCRQV